METFSEIIERWPSVSDLATDLGVPYGVVKQWRRRNSIPSERWLRLIEASHERGMAITAEQLAAAAQRRVGAT